MIITHPIQLPEVQSIIIEAKPSISSYQELIL